MRSRAISSGSVTTFSVISLSCAWLRRERPVHQRRETLAHARLCREIHLGQDTATATRHALQYPSPIIHDHAVAVGLTTTRVEARLGRRHDITEVLDGTCS